MEKLARAALGWLRNQVADAEMLTARQAALPHVDNADDASEFSETSNCYDMTKREHVYMCCIY